MSIWIKVNDEIQKDNVGNELHSSGAIKSTACQKCKKVFNSKKENQEIKQSVPSYKCNSCNFDGNSGDEAFGHIADHPEHKVSKTQKYRLVGYKTILKGSVPFITKKDNEVLILCSDCHG